MELLWGNGVEVITSKTDSTLILSKVWPPPYQKFLDPPFLLILKFYHFYCLKHVFEIVQAKPSQAKEEIKWQF